MKMQCNVLIMAIFICTLFLSCNEKTQDPGDLSSPADTVKTVELYSWINHADNYDEFTKQSSDGQANGYTGLVISEDWVVKLDGVQYPVLATPISKDGPHSFVNIPYREGAKIEVQSLRGSIYTYTVSPVSKNIPSVFSGKKIILTPTQPAHICVQKNNSKKAPLTISYFPEIPKPGGENVTVYEKGLHMVSVVDFKNNETIYLETGAVLKALPPSSSEQPTKESDSAGQKKYRAMIKGDNNQNIKIIGNGIIDTSPLDWHARTPLTFAECNTVSLEGITFVGSGSWTILINKCSNVNIDNVRLYGFRENSDGINIVNSNSVTVKNCWIRTGDDAICVKALQSQINGFEDFLVEKCMIWNDKVRCFNIGGETKSDISNVTFRNCDIVHSTATWSDRLGTLCVIVNDNGTVSDVLYEDIRIEQESLAAINCIIDDKKNVEAGNIKNIVFRNITISTPGSKLQFLGFDANHRISNITIDNLVIGGNKISSLNQITPFLNTNEFVDEIFIK